MWVRNLGVPPPKNLAAQKHQNFGFCDLIANIFGREQDIVDQKTALKTAITPLRDYRIWWTLVHKRRKIAHAFRPTQSTFSDAHISAHIANEIAVVTWLMTSRRNGSADREKFDPYSVAAIPIYQQKRIRYLAHKKLTRWKRRWRIPTPRWGNCLR